MKLLRLIFSIAFSSLVLISGSSFYVGMHLCGGKINAVAVSAEAEGCKHSVQLPRCHKSEPSENNEPTRGACCEDKVLVHEAEGFKNDVQSVSLQQASAFYEQIVTLVIISEVIPSSDKSFLSSRYYTSPLRSVDRTIIHQIFLI